jgi:outer membrane protein TolC
MNATRKRIYNLLIGAALVMSAGKAAAQTQPINMKEAIELALANNYSLRADSMNMLIQAFRNRETAGFFLPQANMSSNMTYAPAIASQMLPGSVVGQPSKELVPVKFGTAYGMGTGIEVTQTIYRKDLSIRNKAAGLNNDIASTRYKLSKEELVYNVAYAFYGLQSRAESIRTTSVDYLSMKEILSIAKAQFEHGILKRIDYESLQINVANKESELNQQITQYSERLDFFKYLLGLPVNTPLTVNDSISSLATHLSKEANLLSREDLRLSYQMIQSKEVEMKSIRAEKLPTLNSFFRFNYQSQFNEAGKAFDNNYWYKSSSVGLSMSLPIFDGNRRKSRLSVAQTQLQQLKWQTTQQEQEAETQIKTSWDKLDNNRRQLKTNEQNLELAVKVFESRKALYSEGVTTLVELLDAQRELTQARDLYIQSLINVQSGILEVHKANGTLITEFFKSI